MPSQLLRFSSSILLIPSQNAKEGWALKMLLKAVKGRRINLKKMILPLNENEAAVWGVWGVFIFWETVTEASQPVPK